MSERKPVYTIEWDASGLWIFREEESVFQLSGRPGMSGYYAWTHHAGGHIEQSLEAMLLLVERALAALR